jgi:hypothetical protein
MDHHLTGWQCPERAIELVRNVLYPNSGQNVQLRLRHKCDTYKRKSVRNKIHYVT